MLTYKWETHLLPDSYTHTKTRVGQTGTQTETKLKQNWNYTETKLEQNGNKIGIKWEQNWIKTWNKIETKLKLNIKQKSNTIRSERNSKKQITWAKTKRKIPYYFPCDSTLVSKS